MKMLPWILNVAVLLAACANPTAAQTADERFDQLVRDSWEFDMRESPLAATAAGDHRFGDQLDQMSLADIRRRHGAKRAMLDRLTAIDAAKLSAEAKINHQIFGHLLRDELAEFDFQSYLMPITNRSGFHLQFIELRQNVPLNTVADYDAYIARLNAFDRYAHQHVRVMRQGIRVGLVLPAIVLDGYDVPIKTHIVEDPTRSLMYEPLTKFPDRISSADRMRLTNEAREAISQGVVPGYRRFLNFMRDEYVPAARGSIGASALPRGREFYRHRVKRFTTLDLSPDEVHAIGQREVKRIKAEMHEIIKKLEFTGDFAAFVKYLRETPRFYAETPEQLLQETAFVLKEMDGKLPALFKRLPRTPYGIRKVPEYIAPRTTTAYYMLPAGDGSRAGFYYVNTYNLKSRPLYGVEALSLHEAVPGHHLQLALQQELEGLPNFRRFSGFTAFVEGWALYAERLGLEVGFYQDPYSDFGRLTYEMWRACRLVVDTGMHYQGWTRKQAIDFMASNTALSLHNIRAEVDRYIAWPGQALGYKMGELKIRALRALAEARLGDKFDIREFHDVVLRSGSVPLTILEGNVKTYIEETE